MLRRAASTILTLCFCLAACSDSSSTSDLRYSSATPPAPVRPHKAASIGPGVILSGWLAADQLAALDNVDRAKNRQAESRAFTAPIGQQVTWANEDSGNSGTVTVTQDGYAASGAYCRQFQQSVTVNGRKLQGHANACQQPDGSWKV